MRANIIKLIYLNLLNFGSQFRGAYQIVEEENAIPFCANDFETLEFQNVTYAVGEGESKKTILNNISFTIHKGDSIGVFGESGSGKSTIMKLIQRNMDPTSGKILLNGIEIWRYRLSDWLQSLGIVSQDNTIYSGTFKTILLSTASDAVRKKVQDSDLIEVLKKVGLDKKLDEKLGFQTKVLGDGVNLSGGEKQRLIIAGVLLRLKFNDIGLLLLDEATSALDSKSEKIVQDAIDNMHTKKASFTIAHRLGTLRMSTRFFGLFAFGSEMGHQQIEITNKAFEEMKKISHVFRKIREGMFS